MHVGVDADSHSWIFLMTTQYMWVHRIKLLQIRLLIRLVEHEPKFLDTSVEKRLHLVTTLLRVADDGHRIHHRIRHQLCRLVALARLVGLAHPIRLRAKTNAVKVLMVKYPHAATVNGNMVPFEVTCCGNISRDVGRDLRRNRDVA